jgi:hypothetical protein
MATIRGQAAARRVDPQECDSVALLRSQIRQVHQLLDGHVTAATERARCAPAIQRDIVSLYAHALCVEDIAVNLLLRDASPLFRSTWTRGQLVPWDLASVRDYAGVVHAGTDVLLAQLTPANLREPVDLSDVGLGNPDVRWVLNTFILWPIATICGEIAVKPLEIQKSRVAPRSKRSNGVHHATTGSTNGTASALVLQSSLNSSDQRL